MTKISSTCTTAALLLALLPFHVRASDCDSNFSSSGNFLTGTQYKSVADLPNINPSSAYQGAYLNMVKQGLIIRQSDSAARVISAQVNNAAPGREARLNVAVEPSPNGSVITLTFATPAGAFSPEASVRSEFCKLVQAAAVPQRDAVRLAATPSTPITEQAEDPPVRTATASGPVCLAGACIGMSLEEAAKLNLQARSSKSTDFSPISTRLGLYGLNGNGQLIGLTSSTVDRAWIQEYLRTVRTMCVVPNQLGAKISASDGTPVTLTFVLRKRSGKIEYGLSSISRPLPINMSVAERKKFETEVRQRYGQAYIESSDAGRTVAAYNGTIAEPVVILNTGDLQLLGPRTPGLAAQLLEQPGCSNKVSLD